MFSATFSNEIRHLAKGLVNNPVEISVSPRNTTVKTVEQKIYPVDKKRQGARTRALADFKQGAVRILVATDIAARGLDIEQLPQVVNFDLPNVPEDYVHRIGRTGRAGASGQAVSLVSADEFKQLSDIERLIQQLLPRELIDGFEPDHDVPPSSLDTRPIRANKPKRSHAEQKTNSRNGQPGRRRSGGNSSNRSSEANGNRSSHSSRNRSS